VLEGDTARQVRQLLRERGMLPMAVSEVMERERRSPAASACGAASARPTSR
jgi:general secretion pathway protein F